jgi:uncharacterized protein (DUF1800 family)
MKNNDHDGANAPARGRAGATDDDGAGDLAVLTTPATGGPATTGATAISTATTLAAAAAAISLAACGGGGGGSSGSDTGTSTGGSGGGGPTATPTSAEASRFLAQASLDATDTSIASVQSSGYAGWIEAQFVAPRSQSHWDWLVANGYTDATLYRNSQNGWNNSAWRKLMASRDDPLRQRVVWALTEIFVISIDGLNITWRQFTSAAYLDLLEDHCFGNFRTLLERITLSVGMGSYLNMRGNQKENPATGRLPDENYAREVLQLFTIGLYKLNRDGSLQRDGSGNPIETYDQATITGLAKVFTGWDYANTGPTLTVAPDRARMPMQFYPTLHSTSSKSFLGTTISGSTDGVTALGIALDTIFNHPNVGPFFGRQLIQRLVTSNPSAAYVDRVAAAFNDNGSGVRGDMKAVIRAVLLDTEARTFPTSTTAGKVREPMLRFVQWARTFAGTSTGNTWNFGSTSDPATRLGQSPLRSPSVFNFFRPGYVPPNTALATQNLVAPELQITNESTVVGYLNFMQTAISNGFSDLRVDYTTELALATDANALVDRVVLLLAANQLASSTVTTIKNAVAAISASTDAGKRNRVYAAVLLTMAAPEYLVQK